MGGIKKKGIGVVIVLSIIFVFILIISIFIIKNKQKDSALTETQNSDIIDNKEFVFKAPNVKTVPKEATAAINLQTVYL